MDKQPNAGNIPNKDWIQHRADANCAVHWIIASVKGIDLLWRVTGKEMGSSYN